MWRKKTKVEPQPLAEVLVEVGTAFSFISTKETRYLSFDSNEVIICPPGYYSIYRTETQEFVKEKIDKESFDDLLDHADNPPEKLNA